MACPVSGIWLAVSPCRWKEPSPPLSCIPGAGHTTSQHTQSSPAPPPRPPAGSPRARSEPCSPRGRGTGGRWGAGSPSGPPRWSFGPDEDPNSEIWQISLYTFCSSWECCFDYLELSLPSGVSSSRLLE